MLSYSYLVASSSAPNSYKTFMALFLTHYLILSLLAR